MRFHLLVNPVAGRRRAAGLAETVGERLRRAGHDVVVRATAAPGDAGRMAAALGADACDRLVVGGGDGTLREVVNARGGDVPWPVALLPVGTANLVCRETALWGSRDPDALADALARARPWRVNLLGLHRSGAPDEWAVATVGAGLDAEIVHRVAALRATARTAGTGGYRQWLRPVWRTFRDFEFPALEATVDGRRTLYGAAVVAQSAHGYGGLFTLAPSAALDAEAMHVVVVSARARRDLPRLLVGAWRGRLDRAHDVRVLRAEEVRIRAARPAAVQADGDPSGTTDVTVRLRRGGLTLLRPA